MLFNTVAVAASLASLVSAAPVVETRQSNSSIPDGTPFGVVAIRSGSDLQYAPLSASQSSLWFNHAQNASCDTPTNSATFYIQEGGLFLYAASATPQQVYVDRSGMGQGKVGYTTGAQPAPRNGERTGFAIDESDHLKFDGGEFLACNTGLPDGSYSLWYGGVSNPGGNPNCTGIALLAFASQNATSCLYTQ